MVKKVTQFMCVAVNTAGVTDGIIEPEGLGVFLVVVWFVWGFLWVLLIDTRKITRLTLSEELEFLGD